MPVALIITKYFISASVAQEKAFTAAQRSISNVLTVPILAIDLAEKIIFSMPCRRKRHESHSLIPLLGRRVHRFLSPLICFYHEPVLEWILLSQ